MFYFHQKSTTFVKDSSLAWAPFLKWTNFRKVQWADKEEEEQARVQEVEEEEEVEQEEAPGVQYVGCVEQ